MRINHAQQVIISHFFLDTSSFYMLPNMGGLVHMGHGPGLGDFSILVSCIDPINKWGVVA